MRKIALSLAFCAAVLLGVPGIVLAQHGHGGGGGHSGGGGGGHGGGGGGGGHAASAGTHTSGYYGGSNYYGHGGYYGGYGGYYGRGYYGYYGWPGYAFLGLRLFSYPWGNSYYDYGYGAPYSTGSYNYGPDYAPPAADYAPPAAANAPSESHDPNVANIEVRVPADATLWVQGQQMSPTGAVRHFYSPPMEPGTHVYEFHARWTDANGKTVDRTKKVDVKPGAWLGVDFNRP